jgi:hypothetical protein
MQDRYSKLPERSTKMLCTKGRLETFFVPPGRGIRDPALGPWPKKFGRFGGGGRRKWRPKWHKSQSKESLSSCGLPVNGVQYSAETLTFLHVKTQQPAASILRSHLQMC